MNDSNRQICIERLKRRYGEIEEILDIIRNDENISTDDILRAQERLKYLKRRLDNDCASGATVNGKAEMTEVERQFYYPAIQEAIEEIKVSITTIPGQQWITELSAAQNHISFYLGQMEFF